MIKTQAAYWLARADDEARRAAASPTPSVRQTHEAFERAYRDYASSAPERGIVLGPPAPHLGHRVEAMLTGIGSVWAEARKSFRPTPPAK